MKGSLKLNSLVSLSSIYRDIQNKYNVNKNVGDELHLKSVSTDNKAILYLFNFINMKNKK